MGPHTDESARFHEIAGQVFEPVQRYLLRRVPREDAEDALSEVMLTVWRRLNDIPDDRALPWCYGVARRTLANQRRGRARSLRLVERLSSEPSSHHPDPADTTHDPALELALESLGESEREILRLWAWEQLEPRELALVLGISPNAATLRLSRAKKKLAELIHRQDRRLAGHIRDRGTQEHHDG